MTVTVTRKGDLIILGDDQVRIECGPVLKSGIATEELLHDDSTADHYYQGIKGVERVDALGKVYTEQRIGRDAKGNVIKVGEPFEYLDHGGKIAKGSRCWYIYKRRDIDPTQPLLKSGDPNPHFVAEDVRNGALLEEDGTPPNRTHYTHVFDEVATRASEEAAIAYGEKLIVEKA